MRFKNHPVLVLCILMFCLSLGDVCDSEMIWQDDFESYSAGSFPSIDWSYSGNSNIAIDNSIAQQGKQSFRLHGSPGGCWEALAHRATGVNTISGSFYFRLRNWTVTIEI